MNKIKTEIVFLEKMIEKLNYLSSLKDNEEPITYDWIVANFPIKHKDSYRENHKIHNLFYLIKCNKFTYLDRYLNIKTRGDLRFFIRDISDETLTQEVGENK